MKQQHSHSIHSAQVLPGEYAVSVITSSIAERREKTDEERRAERLADRIAFADILKMFAWDEAAFARARRAGFPEPLGRHLEGRSAGQFFYSRTSVSAWKTEL